MHLEILEGKISWLRFDPPLTHLICFPPPHRLIGLCLLQNELLPLFLQRHVLKYILGRKIKFHDLAFFDPALYESFRQIIQNAQTKEGEETINRMELCFV